MANGDFANFSTRGTLFTNYFAAYVAFLCVRFTCRYHPSQPNYWAHTGASNFGTNTNSLVDLALWMFDFPEATDVRAVLLRDGSPVQAHEVENYAAGEITLANGVHVRIACSWNLSAGQDAVIEASFYGPSGGAQMRNESGSFSTSPPTF